MLLLRVTHGSRQDVAASKRHGGRSQFYGIANGFVIAAGTYGAGWISGGCFGPAVAVALTSAVP